MLGAMGITPQQAVAVRNLSGIAVPFKQVCVADALQRRTGLGKAYPGCARNKDPYQFLAGAAMFSEHREWIVVPRLQQALQFGGNYGRRGFGWVRL